MNSRLSNLDTKWYKTLYKLALWGFIGASVSILNSFNMFYAGTIEKIIGTPDGIYMRSGAIFVAVLIITGAFTLISEKDSALRSLSKEEIRTNLQTLLSFFWCQSVYFLTSCVPFGPNARLAIYQQNNLPIFLGFFASVLALQWFVTFVTPNQKKV
ncbi:hypothetical protein [Gluconacetobacter tumulicola]|uniref:Uncharacterized protein n=1 Tax=Gluconacetobacter tumulicola TaxID=1017177 RepID=A0A7W4JC33_9PROT|nr:hypothetical protein [Gluconacetobacter tumulicola]MBB2178501.1 hypothetical protein [Gluconacetobacter tumulicola]